MAKILVIEDDEEILELVTEIVSFEDHDLFTARDGKIGIQLAQEHLPDLIICDLSLPEVSGYEVIKILKQDPQTQAIPFIFFSAQARREEIERGLALGANTYLTKPFGVAEFLNVITSYLTPED